LSTENRISKLTNLFLPRVNIDELLSTDSLPAPAKRGDAPKKEEAAPAPAAPKQRQVGIADQIAIRSYVLGKGLKSSMAE